MPTTAPSFEPRANLAVEGYFGREDDPEWLPAQDLQGAANLARSREQHELARAIDKLLRANKNSVADLAEALGMRKENLWAKLAGVKRVLPGQQGGSGGVGLHGAILAPRARGPARVERRGTGVGVFVPDARWPERRGTR